MSGKSSVLCVHSDCRRALPFGPSCCSGVKFVHGTQLPTTRSSCSSEGMGTSSPVCEDCYADDRGPGEQGAPRGKSISTPVERVYDESAALPCVDDMPRTLGATADLGPPLAEDPPDLPCPVQTDEASDALVSGCTSAQLLSVQCCSSSDGRVLLRNPHIEEAKPRPPPESEVLLLGDSCPRAIDISRSVTKRSDVSRDGSPCDGTARRGSSSSNGKGIYGNAGYSLSKDGGGVSVASVAASSLIGSNKNSSSSNSNRRLYSGDRLASGSRRSSNNNSSAHEESRCRALGGVYRAAIGPVFSIVGYYPSETRLLAEAHSTHFRRSVHVDTGSLGADGSPGNKSGSSSGPVDPASELFRLQNSMSGFVGSVSMPPSGVSTRTNSSGDDSIVPSASNNGNGATTTPATHESILRGALELNKTVASSDGSNKSSSSDPPGGHTASEDSRVVKDSSDGTLSSSSSTSSCSGEASLEGTGSRSRLMRQLLVRRRRSPSGTGVMGRKWQGSFFSMAGRKHQYVDDRNEDAGELTTYILCPRRQFGAVLSRGEPRSMGSPTRILDSRQTQDRSFQPGSVQQLGSDGSVPTYDAKMRLQRGVTCPLSGVVSPGSPVRFAASPSITDLPTRHSRSNRSRAQRTCNSPSYGADGELSEFQSQSVGRAVDDEHCGWYAVCHGGSGSPKLESTPQSASTAAAGAAIRLACVFDGHGPPSRDSNQASLGRLVAHKAHRSFCAILEPYLEAIAKAPVLHPSDAAFAACSRQTLVAGTLRRLGEVMTNGLESEVVCRAGCTATVVLAFDEPRVSNSSSGTSDIGAAEPRVSILTTNLGDSRAVAFSFVCKCVSESDSHQEAPADFGGRYAVACTAVRRLTQEQNVSELSQRRRVVERLLRRGNLVFALSAFAGSTRDDGAKIAAAWRSRLMLSGTSGAAISSAASSAASALATERCELGFLPRSAIEKRVEDDGSALHILSECTDMESFASAVRHLVLSRKISSSESAASVFTVQEKYIGVLRVDVDALTETMAPSAPTPPSRGPEFSVHPSVGLPQSLHSLGTTTASGMTGTSEVSSMTHTSPPSTAPIFASRIQLTGSIGDSLLEPLKKAACKAEDVTIVQLEVPPHRSTLEPTEKSTRMAYDKTAPHTAEEVQQVFTIVVTASDGLWYAVDQRFKSEACFGEHFAQLLAERWSSLQQDLRENRNSPVLASLLTNWSSDKTTDDITVAVMNFQGLRIANKVQWRYGADPSRSQVLLQTPL